MTPDTPQMVHVFLGLITNAEDGTVGRVPVVRRRIAEIMLRSGVRADSHTGRQLLAALRTLPRDELLEAPTGDLLRLAQLVSTGSSAAPSACSRASTSTATSSACSSTSPPTGSGPRPASASPASSSGIGPARSSAATTASSNSTSPACSSSSRCVPARSRRSRTAPPSRPRSPRRSAAGATTCTTCSSFATARTRASGCCATYQDALPEAYKEDFGARTAVRDLTDPRRRCRTTTGWRSRWTPAAADDDADRRLKVFRTGQPVSLARALPIFTQMGIEVLDERPYELDLTGRDEVWIYDFGLRLPPGVEFDEQRSVNVVDTVRLLWRAQIEQDGFNALVVQADLTWWQANILRDVREVPAPGRHDLQPGLHRAGARRAPRHRVLAGRPVRVALRSRARDGTRRLDGAGRGHRGAPRAGLEPGPGLDPALAARARPRHAADERLPHGRLPGRRGGRAPPGGRGQARSAPGAGPARTAARASRSGSTRRASRACTCASARSRAAGCAGPTAARTSAPRSSAWSRRRWSRTRSSSRPAPRAASSPSNLPDPSADREAWLAEGVACYRMFICALLDLTDNYRTGNDGTQTIVAPPQVRRYDGDDPYLVVAADKGTATFSDIANGIADEYGFWLGDAFASGGSVGYDHKAMGITARGAWESVKYHFRELGIDTQTQPFTVVGIGDMSGDVFGNGMLLSEQIRLVAAFDHRHIFLDPDPDPATSYRRTPPAVRPAALVLGGLRPVADLRGRRGLSAHAEVDPDHAAGGARAGSAARHDEADADRTDARDPARAGRPVVERRHRYVRQGVDRVAAGGRRQGQRRVAGGRRPAARPRRRRGRQPRPDPARPRRVRSRPAAGSTPTPSTTRRVSTRPTTRST